MEIERLNMEIERLNMEIDRLNTDKKKLSNKTELDDNQKRLDDTQQRLDDTQQRLDDSQQSLNDLNKYEPTYRIANEFMLKKLIYLKSKFINLELLNIEKIKDELGITDETTFSKYKTIGTPGILSGFIVRASYKYDKENNKDNITDSTTLITYVA